MDDLMFELELLQEEEEKTTQIPQEKGPSVSPYKNASQEGMGQMASMFQDIDDFLLEAFPEEDEEDFIDP